MSDWKAKAEEECARLGITDEKQRAFVFEHQRRHAGIREMLAWAKINELMLEEYVTGDDNPYVYNPKRSK